MKLLAIRRDGSTQLLEIAEPFTVDTHKDRPTTELAFWVIRDAQGTDYYFRRDDGTYDGWGRAVSSNAEATQLMQYAQQSSDPPKDKLQ